MNIFGTRPDFVMFGYIERHDDGLKYFVVASNELTQVELESLHVKMDPYTFRVETGSMRISLRTTMRSYMMVWGRSYAEAFITLFNEWSPQVSTGPQLANPQPSIEAPYGHLS